MILKFLILFFMVLTMTLTINYKITTLIKFLKGIEENSTQYYTSLVVMGLMIILTALYFTLY